MLGRLTQLSMGNLRQQFIKAYFPAGHGLQLDNQLRIQNISAFYSNLMESIGGRYPRVTEPPTAGAL